MQIEKCWYTDATCQVYVKLVYVKYRSATHTHLLDARLRCHLFFFFFNVELNETSRSNSRRNKTTKLTNFDRYRQIRTRSCCHGNESLKRVKILELSPSPFCNPWHKCFSKMMGNCIYVFKHYVRPF